MSQKYKQIPNFISEDEERKFWADHSSVDYLDWDKALINPNINQFVRAHSSLLYHLKNGLEYLLFKSQAKLGSLTSLW